ncbi:MAG: ABC transporter permease, partial [Proteobacteria bacterium]|nr:ABC transporter permease [Pseudomonadota bacterium]
MALFLLKRLASLLITLAVASVVVFAVLDLLPGNVAQVMLGESATPEAVAALEAKLGLDRPAPVRYLDWLRGLVTLNFGVSHAYDTPIIELVAERLAVTLPLALLAMALTVVLALAAGLYAASRHNRAGDLGVMALSQLGIAVPSFWFGILLVMLFAVKLPWFPSGGFPGWSEDEGGGLWEGLRAL